MSKHEFSVTRTEPPTLEAGGVLLAGAAERDITPHIGLRMAGYSLGGRRSRGTWGRLFARALVLEDAAASRACLCVCDLMSGTRALLELVGERTARTMGITVDRLILAGTHTHNGPGGIYGNSLYDTLADEGIEPGFEPELTAWLAKRIALTIEQAVTRLEPAVVGAGAARVWNVSRNRSLPAFPDDLWNDREGSPGTDPPAGLSTTQRAVDPRVRVIGAFRNPSRAPIAVFGFFGVHFHATGPETALYTPDAAGLAVAKARAELELLPGVSERVIVAMGASCAADVHTYRTRNMTPFVEPGFGLARHVGDGLASGLVEAARRARATASGGHSVDTRFAEPDHRSKVPGDPPDTALPKRWCFGAPVLTGSEETTTPFEALVREGDTGDDFDSSHSQFPKLVALGGLGQKALKKLLKLAPSPVYPLHQLRIGPIWLATLPGEITTVGAWEIEKALLASGHGAEQVLVVGYAGDYGGYITTEAEFRKQHYEGASTLYGRNVHRRLLAFHLHLAGRGPGAPASGTVEFRTTVGEPRFDPLSRTFADPDPRPSSPRLDGAEVRFTWRMHRETLLVPATEGPVVTLEKRLGDEWRRVRYLQRPFDDHWQAIRVRRDDADEELWEAMVTLPDELRGQPLRFRVLALDAFPGALSEAFEVVP